MRTDKRLDVGRAGEDAALDRYRGSGYALLARNWRRPAGELDLVVAKSGVIVFCEVKTRSGVSFGGGYEAVTATKQKKVRQLAELFLLESKVPSRSVRFDVASVLMVSEEPQVELFEDAF
ncbi:MAG: YraN family protein [Actinomycetota bacterium]